MTILIDPEFKALCPPLSPDEYAALEESLLAEGCRDALVVWDGVLLDGHNRLELCDKHGLSFDTTEITLPSRQDAIAWILRNQLGRRNLHPDAASLMRGRLYNMQKTAGHGAKSAYQNDTQMQTAERLAADLGVSAPTIKRDGKFAEAVATLAPLIPDIPQRAMSGEIVSRQAVIEEAEKVETAQKTGNVYQPIAATVFSYKSVEYYTPAEILNAARAVLGSFDLDPASCPDAQVNVRATKFYTKEDDGLAQSWQGRVWCNPPYGKTGGKSNQCLWAERLADEYRRGNVTEAILLVKAAMGYVWFEDLFRDWPVCFLRSRLSFILEGGDDEGQSKQGTALFYFGPHFDVFANVFREYGRVIPNEKTLNATMFGQ